MSHPGSSMEDSGVGDIGHSGDVVKGIMLVLMIVAKIDCGDSGSMVVITTVVL